MWVIDVPLAPLTIVIDHPHDQALYDPEPQGSGGVISDHPYNAGTVRVEGLYVVSNTMAAVTAGVYGGAGGTLGLGMTFGFIAGRHAAQHN